MYNFSSVMGRALVCRVRMIYWGWGYGGGIVDSISSTKEMFTYVQQKRHIIKYGTVSRFSQAINYASLCSTVWIVIFLHSCTQLWDKNKSWKVTAKLPQSCQREHCWVAGQGCKHIRVKETAALIERNERRELNY